jgi:hypothetical protein
MCIENSKWESLFRLNVVESVPNWRKTVWVDTPKEKSMRYVARRTAKGDFDQLLYGLARQSGLEQAKQLVILGDGAP